MLDHRRSQVTHLVGRRARRAAFVEHVSLVGGETGTQALAGEGLDAHRVSSELQGIARENTPIQTRAARRTAIRIASSWCWSRSCSRSLRCGSPTT